MYIRIILLILILSSTSVYGQKIINVSDFGLKPDTRENAVPFVRKAIEACRKENHAVLFFPKGRYDFWPQHTIEKEYYESNTTDNNPKRLAMLLDSLDTVILDGNGSEFIMHDRIQPITVDGSSRIILKNFTIDWDVPLLSQGTVTHVGTDYFDLQIDSCKYPYVIENGKITFTGEGWKSKPGRMMEFDAQTGIIQQGDEALGKNPGGYMAESIRDNQVSIRSANGFERLPGVGNIMVLRHSERDHAGIFLINSNNISLENITIHHTAGLGILAQYSEDISFKRVNVVPNRSKGRFFSGHDDGFHIMGCRGTIDVDSCRWEGLMDDPINIHGTCVRIMEVLSPTRIRCEFMHHQSQGLSWARKGDCIGFINNRYMNTIATNEVMEFRGITKKSFELELRQALLSGVQAGMAVENLTWTPDVTIQNSKFLSCRARGLLISTPGKVLIENNIFESSGSAILIAGDANYWYESGAVKDVLIRNNLFNYPCLSSMYQFTEAIITILPEIPEVDPALPFHRNIRIEENTFHPFDYPVLYAKSVSHLSFSKNKIQRSYQLSPFHPRKSGITLIGCQKVEITDNHIDRDVLGKDITLEKMKRKELTVSGNPFYTVKKNK